MAKQQPQTEPKGNGHGNPKDIGPKELPPTPTDAPNPIQKPAKFLSMSELDSMVGDKQMDSALDVLAKPGETAEHLSMRTILGPNTEGKRLARAIAITLEDDELHGNTSDEQAVKRLMALFVSDGGIGREQVTSAVTGERKHEEMKAGGGISQWLQNKAFKKKDDG